MCDIKVRYVERTCLNPDAFFKMVKKYVESLKIKNNIVVTFDKRLKCHASHTFDSENNVHLIKVSPKRNSFIKKENSSFDVKIRLRRKDSQYHFIASVIHELKHAQQLEDVGYERYWDDLDWGSVVEIHNPSLSTWYSQCEIEARIYENNNVIEAVKFYDSCCVG